MCVLHFATSCTNVTLSTKQTLTNASTTQRRCTRLYVPFNLTVAALLVIIEMQKPLNKGKKALAKAKAANRHGKITKHRKGANAAPIVAW